MKAIHHLISYGLFYKLIEQEDIGYVNNRISYYLKIEPTTYQPIKYNLESIETLMAPLLEVAIKNQVILNSIEAKDNFEALILDLFTPRPTDLINKFNGLLKKDHKLATGYLYDLMIRNNYIKQARVSKNIKYDYLSEYGKLEITINISKPEKDNKDIPNDKLAKLDYPKCVLCQENQGYYGRVNYNGRSNHRLIPLTLNKEAFYMHYSPYVYYQEHAIVLSAVHTPMKINHATFVRLFDFVKLFPSYLSII